jgi:hypothetical protein
MLLARREYQLRRNPTRIEVSEAETLAVLCMPGPIAGITSAVEERRATAEHVFLPDWR